MFPSDVRARPDDDLHGLSGTVTVIASSAAVACPWTFARLVRQSAIENLESLEGSHKSSSESWTESALCVSKYLWVFV